MIEFLYRGQWEIILIAAKKLLEFSVDKSKVNGSLCSHMQRKVTLATYILLLQDLMRSVRNFGQPEERTSTRDCGNSTFSGTVGYMFICGQFV